MCANRPATHTPQGRTAKRQAGRQARRLAPSLALALGLFACCTLLAATAPPLHAGTTLNLWTSEIHEDRLTVIRYLMDVFMALNDGIDVRVNSVNENELVAEVRRRAGKEEGADLINTGGELMVALGAKGLLDTDAATAFVDHIGKKRFYAGALESLTLSGGGGYYGVPYHGWVQGVWYRKDWFRKMGLAPPYTWEAMLAGAQTFHDPEKGMYGILVGTEASQFAEQIFTQIALSNNARMFAPDGSLAFDSPAMVQALEQYLALAACTPPGPQTWRGRDFYLQGQMAMMFYSTFIMDDLALPSVAADSLTGGRFPDLTGAPFDTALAKNTGMAAITSHRSYSGYGMINGFALAKGMAPATHDAALALLDFLFQPEPYVEWLHMAPGGMLPVMPEIADSDAFMRDPQGLFRHYGRGHIRTIMGGLEHIRNFGLDKGVRHPLAAVFYSERIIPRMIRKALDGELSPRKAVAWAEAEMRRVAAAN